MSPLGTYLLTLLPKTWLSECRPKQNLLLSFIQEGHLTKHFREAESKVMGMEYQANSTQRGRGGLVYLVFSAPLRWSPQPWLSTGPALK